MKCASYVVAVAAVPLDALLRNLRTEDTAAEEENEGAEHRVTH